MIELILEATKPIADAVMNSNKSDTLEILSKVDEFYNSAWDKLLVFGAIIGILVPFVISHYQKKARIASESELETKINSYVDKLKLSLEKDLNEKFEKKMSDFKKDLENKIEKINENANASAFHMQAGVFYDKNQYKLAAKDFMFAATGYTIAEDYINVKAALSGITNCVEHLNKEDIQDLENVESVNLIEELNEIDYKIKGGAFSNDIKKIKAKIYEIMNTPEKI